MIGEVVTVTATVEEPEQLAVLVPETVYTVVTLGVTVMLPPLAPLLQE